MPRKSLIAIIAGFTLIAGMSFLLYVLLKPPASPEDESVADGQVCTNKAADIFIVIDRSASMDEIDNGQQKLYWAKESAKSFVDVISNGDIRVGVAVFGMAPEKIGVNNIYRASVVSPLTNDYGALKTAIDGIGNTDSGTCIVCGLDIANRYLAGSTVDKVVILISDGDGSYVLSGVEDRVNANNEAIAKVREGEAAGITYYTARFGTSSGGEASMKSMATSPENYLYRPTVSELSTLFAGFAQQVCEDVETTEPPPAPPPQEPPPAQPPPTDTTSSSSSSGEVSSSSGTSSSGDTTSSSGDTTSSSGNATSSSGTSSSGTSSSGTSSSGETTSSSSSSSSGTSSSGSSSSGTSSSSGGVQSSSGTVQSGTSSSGTSSSGTSSSGGSLVNINTLPSTGITEDAYILLGITLIILGVNFYLIGWVVRE